MPSGRSRPLESLQLSSQTPTGANSRQRQRSKMSCGTSWGGPFPWMLFVAPAREAAKRFYWLSRMPIAEVGFLLA